MNVRIFQRANSNFKFSFLALLLLTSHVSASTYYVNNSVAHSSDRNLGTAESPLKSIQRGVDRLKPGDTLLISGGIYYERVVLKNSGLPGQPIVIAAHGDQDVIIDGSTEFSADWEFYAGHVFRTSGSNRTLLIEDGEPLEPVNSVDRVNQPGSYFFDAVRNMLYVRTRESDDPAKHRWRTNHPHREQGIFCSPKPEGISDVEIRDLHVRNVGRQGVVNTGRHERFHLKNIETAWTASEGIYLRSGKDDEVIDCTVENSLHFAGRGMAFYEENEVLVKGNVVRFTRGNGICVINCRKASLLHNIVYGNRLGSKENPSLVSIEHAGDEARNVDLLIEGNQIHHGIDAGLSASFTDNLVFRNNVVFDVSGPAAEFLDHHENLKIYNNTLLNALVINGTVAPTKKVDVANNIVAGANLCQNVDDLTADNDLFLTDHDSRGTSFVLHCHPDKAVGPLTLSEFQDKYHQELHGREVLSFDDSLFRSPEQKDFHLAADSLATDGGKDLSAEFTNDADARARPAGHPWAMGAYENTETKTARSAHAAGSKLTWGFEQFKTTLRLAQKDSLPIVFSLLTAGHVKLSVLGREAKRIRTLIDDQLPAGTQSAYWDGKGDDGEAVAPGTYTVVLTWAAGRAEKKIFVER